MNLRGLSKGARKLFFSSDFFHLQPLASDLYLSHQEQGDGRYDELVKNKQVRSDDAHSR